jgi:hypothetical protein
MSTDRSDEQFFCQKSILIYERSHTNSHSNGGIGVSPVQTQAKACGYQKLLFECNSVSSGFYLNFTL